MWYVKWLGGKTASEDLISLPQFLGWGQPSPPALNTTQKGGFNVFDSLGGGFGNALRLISSDECCTFNFFFLFQHATHSPLQYMLVVQLSSIDETEPPSEAGPKPPARVSTKAAPSAVPRHDDKAHSSASSDEVSPASSREHGQQGRRHRQHQFTYCEVDLEKGVCDRRNSVSLLFLNFFKIPNSFQTITASAQKIQIGGHVYEMEDIYGGSTEEEARLQSQGGSVAVGDLLALEDTAECSICLCEPCDTLIMPCRHRCLCSGCAELLRTQSNKCPICRTAITGLLKERSPNPSPSASPLASAAPPRDRLRL